MINSNVQNRFLSPALEQLGNKYQINQEVARNQASSLYQAIEIKSGAIIALKVFRRKFSADPRFALKFRNLMMKIFSIENENLVPILDYGFLDGYYYIASEWVVGQDLASILSEAGSLGEVQAIAIGSQVCQALSVIHRNDLLHLNLKPENVLITSDGRVKLNDVALSGLISESGLSRTHVMLGRYHYIAPEQINGLEPTPESDLYSLGIVLYEMLTGRFPFDSQDVWNVLRMHIESDPPPLERYLPTVSPPVAKLVERALHKTPSMRFSSTDDMNAALTSVIVAGIPSNKYRYPNSTTGVWELLNHWGEGAIALLRKPAPLTIFGKRYPFGLVLLGQFLLSFVVIFLFLSALFTVSTRIWNNRDQIRNYFLPTFRSQQLPKSNLKTNLMKQSQESLEGLIASPALPAGNSRTKKISARQDAPRIQAALQPSLFTQTCNNTETDPNVIAPDRNSNQTWQAIQVWSFLMG